MDLKFYSFAMCNKEHTLCGTVSHYHTTRARKTSILIMRDRAHCAASMRTQVETSQSIFAEAYRAGRSEIPRRDILS